MTTQYTPNFGLALPDFRTGPWHDLVNGDFTKMDQLIFGALSQAETLVWTNGTHYDVGVTVFDGVDASTWMNVVDHTSPTTGTFAQARAANPTYWTQLIVGFAPRGEWLNNTQYVPYDLVYQTSLGIFALCKNKHISNASGTIKDDSAFWSFLVDFSSLGTAAAMAVSYNPTGNLTATNVQQAIDQAEGQIIAINNVNVTQQGQITTLQSQSSADQTRMSNIEAKNTQQDTTMSGLQGSITANTNSINSLSGSKANDSQVLHLWGGTMSGVINTAISGGITTGGPVPSIMVQGNANDWACMSFLSNGVFGANFGMHPNGNFFMGGWSYGGAAYQFWTTRDFASVPTQNGVVNIRLAYAGDIWNDQFGGPMREIGGAVMTGLLSGTSPNTGDGAVAFRFRYLQIYTNNWYTVGFA